MNRRNFCLTVAAVLVHRSPAGAIVAPDSMASVRARDEADLHSLRQMAGGIFRDVEAARDVGRFILASYPEQRDIQRLMENTGFADGLSQSDFVRRFAAKVKEDFANSNTLLLKGWVMSVSEASVCSLLALA